jgi:hypothetical protein
MVRTWVLEALRVGCEIQKEEEKYGVRSKLHQYGGL